MTRPDISFSVNAACQHMESSTMQDFQNVKRILRYISGTIDFGIRILSQINPIFHARSKHIEIDYHFIREKVAFGHLVTRFVSSPHQLADVLTKPLSKSGFTQLRTKLGMWSRHLRGSNEHSHQKGNDHDQETN
ncbi:uncharacterized protein LOC109709084 [Ananas comosus]|uniref:Uncharacterized protein LOC109709084 n=1 Tax=Ananas comosus TaxID=4615 RepID=A0A6P5ET65_ANACO|nr:uncharacterized protein LOC109709084 [Ananas comosus]